MRKWPARQREASAKDRRIVAPGAIFHCQHSRERDHHADPRHQHAECARPRGALLTGNRPQRRRIRRRPVADRSRSAGTQSGYDRRADGAGAPEYFRGARSGREFAVQDAADDDLCVRHGALGAHQRDVYARARRTQAGAGGRARERVALRIPDRSAGRCRDRRLTQTTKGTKDRSLSCPSSIVPSAPVFRR